MNVFVTGSTGLLGSNLVTQLIERGYSVKAMARTAEKAQQFLGNSTAEIVLGDMLGIAAIEPHLAGSDVLIHAAAYFKEYTGVDADAEEMLQKINVDGTIALFEAAKRQGINNIVYTSSSGVIGKPAAGTLADESTPYNTDSENAYFQSKIRGEIAIEEWLVANPDMRVVLIRPGAIIGPGDNGPTGFGSMIIEAAKGKLPAMPPGSVSTVDVRDLADGMINAIERGSSGEAYTIVGPLHSLTDIIKGAAVAAEVKPPSFVMPYPVAWTFGAVSELVAKVTNNKPLATRINMKTLSEARAINSEKAQRELGVTYRPLADSLRDQINWFREYGYV